MFDKITVRPRSDETHYHNHEVTVNRAPTDASVALLMEMERAAKDKVIAAVGVRDMGFECVMHLSVDMLSMQYRCEIIFSLNGERHHPYFIFNAPDGPFKGWIANRSEIAKIIETKLSEYLAKVILNRSLTSFIHTHGFGEFK